MSKRAGDPHGEQAFDPAKNGWLTALCAEFAAHGPCLKCVGVCPETPVAGVEIIPAGARPVGQQVYKCWWVRAFNGRAEFYLVKPFSMGYKRRQRPNAVSLPWQWPSGDAEERRIIDLIRRLLAQVGMRRFDTLRFETSHYEGSGFQLAETCPWLPDREMSGRPSVYFIAALAAGRVKSRVKIGYAGDVSARRKALSRLSPYPLTLLGTMPGDRKMEAKLHRRFRRLRRHGEWFSLEGGLVPFFYEHFEWQIVE